MMQESFLGLQDDNINV